jgi:cyclopropane fatty-acyl-phospholipid synthase-like methyltransferase
MECTRETDFLLKKSGIEKWHYKDGDFEHHLVVNITFGKPLNVTLLKNDTLINFQSKINSIKKTRGFLFGESEKLEEVTACPVCGENSGNSVEVFKVYNASYHQCNNCSHSFVHKRPTKEALDKFYSNSKEYQSTYADKKSLELRVNEVAIPKAEYVINEYYKIYGQYPKRILDIGAGSGHFVYACKKLGFDADGIEISEPGRSFCKENFGFELIDKDFILNYSEFTGYDIITFWGVIEHVPYPNKLLSAARSILNDSQSLIAVEVPKWDSFGTVIQRLTSDSIIRHLEPLGHINVFTDMSLITAFLRSGFDIKAAWYFGMDAYELITQLACMTDSDRLIENAKVMIPILQELVDMTKVSDEVVYIGIPWKIEQL